jgi:hypothetical protein
MASTAFALVTKAALKMTQKTIVMASFAMPDTLILLIMLAPPLNS